MRSFKWVKKFSLQFDQGDVHAAHCQIQHNNVTHRAWERFFAQGTQGGEAPFFISTLQPFHLQMSYSAVTVYAQHKKIFNGQPNLVHVLSGRTN